MSCFRLLHLDSSGVFDPKYHHNQFNLQRLSLRMTCSFVEDVDWIFPSEKLEKSQESRYVPRDNTYIPILRMGLEPSILL